MSTLLNNHLRSAAISTFIFTILLCGASQMGHACATSPSHGELSGHLLSSGHAYTIPTVVELLPTKRPGASRSTKSTSRGTFSFTSVEPGKYCIVVHAPIEVKKIVAIDRSRTKIQLEIPHHKSVESASARRFTPARRQPHGSLSFLVAGIQGTTAPSGYSAGSSEETASQSIHHLERFSANTHLITDTKIPTCSQANTLLRKYKNGNNGFQDNLKLGIFYLAHARYKKSIQHLLVAHTITPSNNTCTRDLALAYLSSGHTYKSIVLLKGATREAPSSPLLHLLIAEAYREEGDSRMARAEFLSSAASEGNVRDFFIAGAGLIEIGDPKGASKLFLRGIKLYPNSARLFMGLGVARTLQHQKTKAFTLFLRAVNLKPDFSPPYQFLAQMANIPGYTYIKIKRRITGFVVSHPKKSIAHYDYALMLWEHSKNNISIEQLEDISKELRLSIRYGPVRSDYYSLLGVINADQNLLRRAVNDFKKSIVLDPMDAEAHYRLSLLYRRLGKSALAKRQMNLFLKLHSKEGVKTKYRTALGSSRAAVSITPNIISPCPHILPSRK